MSFTFLILSEYVWCVSFFILYSPSVCFACSGLGSPQYSKEASAVAGLVFWISALQNWKKRSRHQKMITLLMDCREKHSESQERNHALWWPIIVNVENEDKLAQEFSWEVSLCLGMEKGRNGQDRKLWMREGIL